MFLLVNMSDAGLSHMKVFSLLMAHLVRLPHTFFLACHDCLSSIILWLNFCYWTITKQQGTFSIPQTLHVQIPPFKAHEISLL